MRIVFFGTPSFAVPSLKALIAEGAQVVGVVTQPDRPRGRSRSTMVPPPVKCIALEHHLPVFQPERPQGDVFRTTLAHLEPTLGVVVAYGHILRPAVLQVPSLGMINVHASLLPRHRGAAPIQHAILAGDAETGVTIMQMDEGMDSGPILTQLPTPIDPEDTAGSLADRLADLGGTALVEALALLRLGQLHPTVQNPDAATFAPKIDRAMARIVWDAPASEVARQIRAFDPEPGAWSELHNTTIKLFHPSPVDGPKAPPGTVTVHGKQWLVATGEGSIALGEVQPGGKRRMSAMAWLAGRGVTTGDRLV